MNMDYCKWQNTDTSLDEAIEKLESTGFENMSEDEKNACKRVLQTCRNLSNEFEYLMDDDEE